MLIGASFALNAHGMEKPKTKLEQFKEAARRGKLEDLIKIQIDLDFSGWKLFEDNFAEHVLEDSIESSNDDRDDELKKLKYLVGIMKKANEIKTARAIINTIQWINRRAEMYSELSSVDVRARQYLNQVLQSDAPMTTSEFALRAYAITGTLLACIYIASQNWK